MAKDRMDTTNATIPLRTHWIPRFIAAGVDYLEMQQLLGRIEHWSDWCREWCAVAAAHERAGHEALAQRRFVTAGQARGDRRAIVNAQVTAMPFYARHGFVATGEVFEEAGIPHRVMTRDL